MLEQVPCARGIKPKCSHCTLQHFLNRWEGAKDITGLLVIHFTMLKKKKTVPLWTSSLEICVFSVFGLMYASAHFTRSKKGDLASHSCIQIVDVNWRWIALEGTGLYRLTIEFVHRVLLSNCSHCLLL